MDLHETSQERLQIPERPLGLAVRSRARRVRVDFEKDPVRPCRDGGSGQNRDELALSGRLLATGTLHGVRGVEEDGTAERAHDRERSVIDDEVAIPERGAAL